MKGGTINFPLLEDQKPFLQGKRIAIYSHDTLGLGHMRRNLLISQTLVKQPINASVLMISGAHLINNFSKPDSVDFLTLPSVKKRKCGNYSSRFLDLSLNEITKIRSKVILSAMEGFQPDVFIVDGVPRGLNKELDATLNFFRRNERTFCILGLRDILDDPDTIKKEWVHRGNEEAILDYFDSVWIYGDREVYDSVKEYDFSNQIAEKINFIGYLDRRMNTNNLVGKIHSTPLNGFNLTTEPFVLCMSGGGEDGAHLVDAFSKAKFPADTHAVILTGPYMPSSAKKKLYSQTAKNPFKHILEFHPEPIQLLSRAKSVISMGGYNTLSEILSYKKRALIVPRVAPRTEQLIRAQRFSDLGLVDTCHPGQLSSRVISEWLKNDESHRPHNGTSINFKGLKNLQLVLAEYLATMKYSKVLAGLEI